jgi:Tol biopolymer transport system component
MTKATDILLVLSFPLCSALASARDARYEIAFASFAALNTDVFLANRDGSDAKPIFADPDLDSNASFSRDGRWIVFTSRRNGSSDIFRAHPDGTGLEALVSDPAFDDQGALSPSGNELAFVSTRSGQADIWILNIRSKSLRNLTQRIGGNFRPAWSPDGKWLAFSSDRDSSHPRAPNDFVTRQSTEIYVIGTDGKQLRRITNDHQFSGGASWSPDGRRLVFYTATIPELMNITGARRNRGTTQIVSVDIESGLETVMTSGPGEKLSPRWLSADHVGYVSGGPEGGIEMTNGVSGARGEFQSPSWSEDGAHMLFHRDVNHAWPPNRSWYSKDPTFALRRIGIFGSYSPDGKRMVSDDQTAGILHNSIYVSDADGSARSVLFTSPDKSALAPAWSPDARTIAFSLGQYFQQIKGAAQADIAVVGADGTGFRVLTDGKGNYGFPSWSKEGKKKIVFRDATGGRSSLKILELETGEIRVLITGDAHYNFPSWSPTRDVIAFTADIDGDYDIYTINSDGSALSRLTTSPGNDAHGAWSPDGEWIAFTSVRQGFKDEAVLHIGNPQPSGEICVMRADGSDVRVLTDDQYEEGTPTWVTARPTSLDRK